MDKDKGRNQGAIIEDDILVADRQPSSVQPVFDPKRYADEIADMDLTDEQAAEYLGTIWEIMKAFVDLGFGVDSVHHVLPQLAAIPSDEGGAMIESRDSDCSKLFENAASVDGAKEGVS